jgi:hypothetical protein
MTLQISSDIIAFSPNTLLMQKEVWQLHGKNPSAKNG